MTEPAPTRRYASAGGVVVDSRGDSAGDAVLVLLRRERAGPDGRPEVRLPKGHIEPGESRVEAALREVAEEGGIGGGASGLAVLADLGHQVVAFDWQGCHYVRDESCFLMCLGPGATLVAPERQFERLWLGWEDALARITFEAERVWVRRARAAWVARSGVG